MSKRWKHIFLYLAVSLFIAVNFIAAMQARSLMHLGSDGSRTPPVETLSFFGKVGVFLTGVNFPKPQQLAQPEKFDLQFKSVKIKSYDGLVLDAWLPLSQPTKAWVLMLHGFVSEKSSVLPEAKAFQDLGYSPVLLDFRASGASEGLHTSIGYFEAEDTKQAYKYLQGLAPVPIVIYGKSMGAAAALRAAGPLGLRPKAMVLECPFDNLLNTIGHRFELMGLPAFPFAELLVGWGSLLEGFNGFAHNPATYATSVKSPTLLLDGDLDKRARPEDVRRVYDALSVAKRFEVFEKVGHESMYVAEPERWLHFVSEFL